MSEVFKIRFRVEDTWGVELSTPHKSEEELLELAWELFCPVPLNIESSEYKEAQALYNSKTIPNTIEYVLQQCSKKYIPIAFEPGTCPKCGGRDTTYTSQEIECEELHYRFTCNSCNTESIEIYNLTFVQTEVTE